MKVSVVGGGRMGLPIAAHIAGPNAEVIVCDIDRTRVSAINQAKNPFPDEPGLTETLATAVKTKRLTASTDTTAAVSTSDVVLVLIRLDMDQHMELDYRAIDDATNAIGAGLSVGCTVIYETTLPVGDTRSRFKEMLEQRSGLVAGKDFHLCFSPERVSSGRISHDLATYPKIVGGLTRECAAAGVAFYRSWLVSEVWEVSALETAELTKVAETTYRYVNIALADELAIYADQVGVEFDEVINAANSQPYSNIHNPGIGVGGHCIPVYPHFIIDRAENNDLILAASRRDSTMVEYGVQRIEKVLGSLAGANVLILGATYRPDVAETSHSTIFPLTELLTVKGARVRVNDPLLGPDLIDRLKFTWCDIPTDWPSVVVINAMHSEYRTLAPQSFPGLKVLFDGRGGLESAFWENAGIRVIGIGK